VEQDLIRAALSATGAQELLAAATAGPGRMPTFLKELASATARDSVPNRGEVVRCPDQPGVDIPVG
jgi:hypothetical protein